MIEFNESRPEFSGVTKFYRDEILPNLLGKDMKRRAAVRRFLMVIIPGVILMVVSIIGFMGGFNRLMPRAYSPLFWMAGFLAAGVVFMVGAKPLQDIKKELKDGTTGRLASFFGWHFRELGFVPVDPKLLKRLGLFPGWDRSKYEDSLSGTAHGAAFRLHEAHLERKRESKNGSNYVTVFRGIVMEIDFHRDFAGETIILREKGFFNRKKKSGLKRVGLVDPKFEKLFEAYGSDQVEARYLLTPTFMQRLVDLETLVQGKELKAAFTGGKLLITVKAPNQFEGGSVFKSFADPERVEKTLAEFDLVFGIIDGVMKPAPGRLYAD